MKDIDETMLSIFDLQKEKKMINDKIDKEIKDLKEYQKNIIECANIWDLREAFWKHCKK